MNIVQEGILDGYRTLKDNTLKITIHSQEMSEEEAATLYKLTNTHVKFHISNNNINDAQIKAINDAELEKSDLVNGKTKAQRIRGIMFLAWENKGRPEDSFEQFYNLEMERIIGHLKEVYL